METKQGLSAHEELEDMRLLHGLAGGAPLSPTAELAWALARINDLKEGIAQPRVRHTTFCRNPTYGQDALREHLRHAEEDGMVMAWVVHAGGETMVAAFVGSRERLDPTVSDMGDIMGQAANEMVMLIQNLNVMLDPIMEAAQGYVEKAKAHGFDDASASRMGADYHGLLAEVVKNQALGKKK